MISCFWCVYVCMNVCVCACVGWGGGRWIGLEWMWGRPSSILVHNLQKRGTPHNLRFFKGKTSFCPNSKSTGEVMLKNQSFITCCFNYPIQPISISKLCDTNAYQCILHVNNFLWQIWTNGRWIKATNWNLSALPIFLDNLWDFLFKCLQWTPIWPLCPETVLAMAGHTISCISCFLTLVMLNILRCHTHF